MWIIWILAFLFNYIVLTETDEGDCSEILKILFALTGPITAIFILAVNCAKILKEK